MAVAGTIAAAAIGAGATAYSSNQQAKAAKKGSQSTSAPWATQAPYLELGMKKAHLAVDHAEQNLYGGPWDPGSNANLDSGWQRMTDWSNGAVNTGADAMQTAGLTGINGFGQQMGWATDLYNRGGQDQTGATMARAGQFASSPYADGLVDASLRDVNRNLQLGLADNNGQAVARGGMNNTRAGVTEALLTSGAQDRAADISSQIRSNLYGQGLSLANTQLQNQFGNQMNALNTGMQGSQMGAGMFGQGAGLAQGAINAQLGVGDQQRLLATQGITADLAADKYNRETALDLAGRYQAIVGGAQYGNQQQATTPYQGPDALTAGVGAFGQVIGLGDKMGTFDSWKNQPGSTWDAQTRASYYNPMSSGNAMGTQTNALNGNYSTGYGNYVSNANAVYYP